MQTLTPGDRPDVVVPRPSAPPSPYAGLWARGAAAAVDVLLLFGVVSAIGFPLATLWTRLSCAAVWVGFALTIAYSGLLNSSLGGGQSLGKRLLHIRVVGPQGAPVAPAHGLLRALILAFPAFMGRSGMSGLPSRAAMLHMYESPPAAAPLASQTAYWLLAAVLAVVGAVQAYLVLANHPAHRGLHDLASGTIVVPADRKELVEMPSVAPVHRVVVLVILALSAAAGLRLGGIYRAFTAQLGEGGPSRGQQMQAAVLRLPGVNTVRVRAELPPGAPRTGPGPNGEIVTLVVGWAGPHQAASSEVADQAAIAALGQAPELATARELIIRVERRWNLGFGTRVRHEEFRRSPAQWQPRLRHSPPTDVEQTR